MPRFVELPTKSSKLGRTMKVDLSVLEGFRGFWREEEPDRSPVWQVMADTIINRSYLDYPSITSRAVDISYGGLTVHHRNHDVTHAVRQHHYADEFLKLIESNGNETFTPIAAEFNADKEKKAALQLAIYLCRSGRTNESSGKDDPSNAKRSSEVFEVTARELGFDEGLIQFLKFSMATHKPDFDSCPELIAGIPGENKREQAELMKGVIDLSHHTDLVRCKTGGASQPVRAELEHDLAHFLDPVKMDIERATTNVLLHAIDAVKETGTRVKYREFGSHTIGNVAARKVLHTMDVHQSMESMRALPFDPRRITHEGVRGEFEEIMRQASIKGTLDLTNVEMDDEQLARLYESIASNNIHHVSLLGLKPVRYQEMLYTILREKEKAQASPISITHTLSLPKEEVDRINTQFCEEAVNEHKVSMRFEPSRLAKAHKSGSFLTQVGREISGDVPQFGGEKHFAQVVKVAKLSSPEREAAYEGTKHPVSGTSRRLTEALHTMDMPDIELAPGEVLLFHGTSPEVAALIMQSGFDEERCAYVQGNGYGPVGRGVYFTPDLAKAATFSQCGMCGEAGQCGCVDEVTGEPAERSVLLSKVFIGNPEVLYRKGDLKERRKGPSKGFDCAIGISKRIKEGSEFRSTEVCVPRGAQALPLYEIKFTSQPNLLEADMFKSKMRMNGLASDPKYEGHIESMHIKLLTLGAFKEMEEVDFRDVVHRASILEKEIDLAISNLESDLKVIDDLGGASIAASERTIKQRQLNDMKNVLLQVRSLKQQSSFYRPKSKLPVRTEQSRELTGARGGAGGPDPAAPRPKTLSTGAMMRKMFLPKEVRLKYDISELHKGIKEAESPKTFLDKAILLLEASIQRDTAKSSYPAHRVITTQAIIALKDALDDLKESTHPDAVTSGDIQVRMKACLEKLDKEILGESNRALRGRILNSNNYKSLRLLDDDISRMGARMGVALTDVSSADIDHSDRRDYHEEETPAPTRREDDDAEDDPDHDADDDPDDPNFGF